MKNLEEQLLAEIRHLASRIDDLEALLIEQQADAPEDSSQQDAARLLGKSPRTLQRWRADFIQGVHWWLSGHSPRYNVRLIKHGDRHGFNSPAHLKACRDWQAQQTQQHRRRA